MADANAVPNTNTIQAEENAMTPNALSSSERSLIPPTPTPQPDEGTPSLPPDTGTEAAGSDPAPAAPATPAPEPATGADGQPLGTDGKPSSTPQWVQRRIDKLTAEKHEARRQADAAQAESKALLAALAEARAGVGAAPAAPAPDLGTPAPAAGASPVTPAPKPVVPMAEAEIEARATAKATEIARANAFNRACNDIADAGKSEFKDFDDAINNFNLQGGIPGSMLEILTDMPNAHKVLYAAGKDPELIERLIKLPPTKMAMELARLESAAGQGPAPKPLSGAPRPITPIDGGARASEDPEKMDTKAWIEWREKTKKSRW